MTTGYGTLGMDTKGTPAKMAIDGDTEAIVVTPDMHNGIHQGVIYSHTFTSSASTSGAFYVYSGSGESHASIAGFSTEGPDVNLVFYEASGTSSGMSSSGFSGSAGMANRNRRSTNESNLRIMTGSGVWTSTSATALPSHYVGGGTGVGGSATGSSQGGEEEWLLAANTFYAWKYELATEQKISLIINSRDY